MTDYHPFRSTEAKEKCLTIFNAWEKSKWPIESEKRYVETSYGKTFVRISGPENGPPLVLLHGFGGNSLLWSGSIETLSKSLRTYAVDIIDDYGLSICTTPIKNGFDYAKWLDEFFTGLGLGNNINLLGISYGGWITSQYALHFQSRLNKIVLLAPACTVLPLRIQFYLRQILMILPFRFFKESFFTWVDPTVKNSKGFQEGIDLLETSMKCFKPRYKIARPTVLNDEELKSIKCRSLFLIGEYDNIYSPQKAINRLDRIAPNIEKEIIPDVGHMNIVYSHETNKKVTGFLV